MMVSIFTYSRMWLGMATPILSLLFLTILTSMPITLPASIQVTPAWIMMGVVFWTINRPELIPIWAIFIIGLLRDGLGGGVIGISPLLLIITHEIILLQRRVLLARSFLSTWMAFSLSYCAFSIIEFIIFALADRPSGLFLLFEQYLFSVTLFPLVAYILTMLTRVIVVAPTITIELGGRYR